MSTSPPPIIRSRRRNYWEAIYSPDIAASFSTGDWLLPELGANQKLFDSKDLKQLMSVRGRTLDFTKVRFVDCDFTGFFTEFGRAIVFKNCKFERCDFGSSTWERAKFAKCDFCKCSFTQSSWTDCEFRRCQWSEVSMAGNETNLARVYIDNPQEFIDAAYTNLDPEELAKRSVSADFQRTRLEETKATVARSLYESHREVGDDVTFHKVCRVFTLQGIKSRRASLMHESVTTNTDTFKSKLRLFRLAFQIDIASTELLLTRAFGAANSWGLSLARPLGLLVLTFAFFWLINALFVDQNWTVAGLRSFDVTSVAGYTMAVGASSPTATQIIADINLVLALFAYTVFFSTAVAKVSRFR